MRRIIVGALLVAVAAMLCASVAFAQRGNREFRLGWISERLELDKETAAAVDAVIAETEPAAKELRRQERDARRALRDLLSADLPEVDAVMAQIERAGAAEIAADKHRVETMLRIRALLTAEQRAELASMEKRGRPPKSFEACKDDIAAFCADAPPGRPAIRCLRGRRDELSEACREAMPRRGKRGPRHGPHDGGDHGPDYGREGEGPPPL